VRRQGTSLWCCQRPAEVILAERAARRHRVRLDWESLQRPEANAVLKVVTQFST
jgi:hypothetical protein